jgi:DNA-binding ferritin-like protein (Dps family)
MINYKIKRIDPLSNAVSVVYSKEGKIDWHGRISLPYEWTEDQLYEAIDKLSEDAESYWLALDRASDVTISNSLLEGTLKDKVFEDRPVPTDEFIRDYDTAYQKVVRNISETDSTKTYGWEIVDYTVEELAANVRRKRAALLMQTDIWAFSDRTMPEDIQNYRQALRDIPEQEGFPRDVIWPIKPLEE